MISVIICSHKPSLLSQIELNISETIGVPFELIVINNLKNEYNIFQAYNIGVQKCNYEIICFVHEDVNFLTECWGRIVFEHFKDNKVGIIGVAGDTAFPSCPSLWWWQNSAICKRYINIIQHTCSLDIQNKSGLEKNKKAIKHDYFNPKSQNKVQVVTLDGVFFCVRREVFNRCRFDDIKFNGFHCYDLDLVFQILKIYKAFVVFDILIEHFSQGNTDKSRTDSIEVLVTKWREALPIFADFVPDEKIRRFDLKCLRKYCEYLYSDRRSNKKVTSIVREYFDFLPIQWSNKDYYLILLKFFLSNHYEMKLETLYFKLRKLLSSSAR
jgi:hypothetical protein